MDKIIFEIFFEKLDKDEVPQLAVQATINNKVLAAWNDLPINLIDQLESSQKAFKQHVTHSTLSLILTWVIFKMFCLNSSSIKIANN